MIYRLVTRREVEEDILKPVEWYEQKASSEIAKDFDHELRAAFDRIIENPLLFMVRHRRLQVRWAFPNRFPYRIVFLVEHDLITILCVAHSKRHDRVWLSRT